ncbi:MAG: hypothetical protein HZC41_17915 [Chloroflexi bacterium]|nr:hypothetical protein [Chloroflexota bacterium]
MVNDLKRQLIEQGVKPAEIRKLEAQARKQAAKRQGEIKAVLEASQPEWARQAKQAAAEVTAKFGVKAVNWLTSRNSPLTLVLILIAEYITLAEAFGYLASVPIALILAGAVLTMLVYLVFRRAVLEHSTQRGNREREYPSVWLALRRGWRLIVGGKRPRNETELDQLDAAVSGFILLQVLGSLYARLHGVIVKYNGRSFTEAIEGVFASDLNTLFLTLIAVLLTVRLISSLEHVAHQAAATFVRVAGKDGLDDSFLASFDMPSLETLEQEELSKLLQEAVWMHSLPNSSEPTNYSKA